VTNHIILLEPWAYVEGCDIIRAVPTKNLEKETTIFMSHILLVDWTSQVMVVEKNLPAKASRRKRLKFDP